MISEKFFAFYKKTNIILKLLLFGVVLVFAAFWVIGSLAKFDRAVMFLIGMIVGAVLLYIYYPQISEIIQLLGAWLNNIFSST